MMRGLILGAVSGLTLSAVALGTLSLIAEQPAGNRPPDAPATAAPATEPPPAGADAPADAPAGRPLAENAGPQPAEAAPGLSPPQDSGAPLADTSSAAQPDVASPEGALTAPSPAAEGPSRERPSEDRVALPAQGPALRPPVTETLPQAAPAVPVPRGTPAETPELDTPDEDGSAPVTPAGDAPLSPGPAATPGAPRMPSGSPDLPGSADALPPAQPDVALDLATLAQPGDDVPPAVAGGGDMPGPGTQSPLAPAAGPDDAPEGTGAAEGPAPLISLQGDMPRLPGGDSGVVIRRPGSDSLAPAQEPEDDIAEPALPVVWQAAARFENAAGLPPVAIILIDDGSLSMGVQIVASLDMPVTVALDPTAPDAAGSAAAYHAAGVEVAALAALPDGATPTDAVVALQASFVSLPEAVALVDAGGNVAASRELAQAVLGWLGTEGRGLAWLASGADQAARAADGANVPSRAILHDLDGNGQEEGVIRRFLDNAPMRARQDGAAVLLARLRPETVNALSLWSATARAGSVTLAPLSVALTEGMEPPAER